MSNIDKKSLSATALLLAAACGSAEESVETAAAPPAVSVKVAEVMRGDVQTWVFAEGTARAVNREFLSFESAGRIAYVDQDLKEGDSVKQGQLIAYQEKNRPLASGGDAQSEITHAAEREAKANLELARKTFDRFKTLLEQNSASQQEFDEAKAKLEQADVQYRNALITADESRIVSPIDGVLARLNIEQGFYYSPQQIQSSSEAGALNTVPVVIIDPSAFEVTVSLPSYAFRRIEVGADVLFHASIGETIQGRANSQGTDAPSLAPVDYSIRGKVYAISPSVDPETRTFAVKLRTTHGAEQLQDGEFVTVWIAGPSAADTLTIPIDSVRYENNAPFVFRIDPQTNKAAKIAVVLGLLGRESRQVLQGLDAGDLVATEGRARLSDGDLVRIIGDASETAAPEEVAQTQ